MCKWGTNVSLYHCPNDVLVVCRKSWNMILKEESGGDGGRQQTQSVEMLKLLFLPPLVPEVKTIFIFSH